jgi:protocatechuate 3,4-dioxygenase beta subunit
MKGGAGGTALLLAAAAIVVVLVLALDRGTPPDRAPRASERTTEIEPAPSDAPPPPEPPDAAAPERATELRKPGARLVGRVTDEEGHPVPGAGIWLSKGMGPGEGEIVARAGDDGRYLYDGVDGEARMVGALAAGHAPSDLRRILPATAPVFEIDFELRRGGGTLSIAVGDAEAKVSVEPLFRGDRLWRRTLDVSGRVTVEGLVPEWNVLRVRARGHAPQTLLARLPPEGVAETSVKLAEGAVVFGTVRGPDGAPAPGARVDLVGWEWAEVAVVADETGVYRMQHAPVAFAELRATAGDAEARTLLKLEEGKEYGWDPVLELPADITGRVVDEGGAPVRASLSFWPVGSARSTEVRELDPDGSFRLRGLPNRQYRIAVWWRGTSEGPPAAEVTAVPGGEPVTIILPRAQGFLRGVITTRDGLLAAGATARTWPSGSPDGEVRSRAAADGSFRLGPLPAGSYFLELHLDGEPTLHLDGIELRTDETRELGVLRFAAGGHIRVRVVDAAGAPVVPEEEARVRSLDATVTFVVREEEGALVSEELVPGRYLVSGGMKGILEEAEVRAGETKDVVLKLRGGGLLEAVALDSSGSFTWATFEIKGERGHRVALEGPDTRLLERLASGSYRITATDGRGARDSRDVEIPADGRKTQVALSLR